MRLYLSSYQIGDYPEKLISLVGSNKKVAVIVNANDSLDKAGRDRQLQEQMVALTALGFEPEELDLRSYFGNPQELEALLPRFGLVWVKGGNCFVLKRAIEQSGFDQIIQTMLEKDAIAYGGFSAGVVILTPTLKCLDLCDDATVVPDGYNPQFNWDGLNIVNYSILPHYRSDHPESPIIEHIIENMDEVGLCYRTLRDGEVILKNGEKEEKLERRTNT